MHPYSPHTARTRAAAGVAAVLASALLLGGQLGLFQMRATEAAVLIAKAKAAPFALEVYARRQAATLPRS